jgi:predicted NAD/FAD-binding protein
MKIAIIGTGISGNGAAWALHGANDITLYEKNDRVGGHSNTVTVDYDGDPIAVDTGFIVYNTRNYPDLTSLFDFLEVPTENSNMSFAVSLDGGRFEYGIEGKPAVFAQKRNAINPRFLMLLREIFRFNKTCLADRDAGLLDDESLGRFLDRNRFSGYFRRRYLLPMGGAIWSTPLEDVLDYPARSFIDFFDNHGLVHPGDVPQWRTVTGGSRSYVRRLTAAFHDRIRLGAAAVSIERKPDGVTVRDSQGGSEDFDHVIVASHSDEALAMLADPTPLEQKYLSAIRYRPNDVYLHRDPSLMPKREAAWSAWNYLGWPRGDSAAGGRRAALGQEMAVTYWMNRLQNIDNRYPLFVSLNPPRPPREELTFATFNYAHPQYDASAREAREAISAIQGSRRTWYCGAYHGFGFHEDGLRSGLDCAEALGAVIPWRGVRDASPFEMAAVAE